MSYSALPFTSKLFQLTSLTCALALAGCGGGDGTDTIAPTPDLGVQPGEGNNGENQQPIESLNISNSKLVDADGNEVTAVSLNGAYYEVEVTDAINQPVANVKVSFAIDAEGIALSQTTSGSMLTNSEGIARIFLKPNGPDVSGAYTILATANGDNNTATDELTFSVQSTNVNISPLMVEDTNLASGGQTALSLKVTDTSGNSLSGVLVNLNTSCGQIPAQMSSDSDGMIEVVYKAINQDNTLCSGNANISANAGRAVQSTNVSVQAPKATSIVYTSNDLTLGIQNSGSSSTGLAEFTVYSNNTPLANANVLLSLEKSPFGLTFGELGNKSDFYARTDANGKVSVNIYPGTTPGPVEIKATLASDERINALSKDISIASSRVTQDGLSISFGSNALDWGADGNETPIVARMVDRNGNAVPDGTVINFTTEGGKVSPASCSTTDGDCDVTFSTQNPRPGDGRVSVLAVAEGEKAYIDQNENNAWDEGVDILVHNIGDTFRDDNENNTFEIGEFTYPLVTQADQVCQNNIDQFIQLKFPNANNMQKRQFEQNYVMKYVVPNKANTCNSGLDAVVRFQSIQLVTAGQGAEFTLVDAAGNSLGSQTIDSTDTTVRVRINSGGVYNLNPMPSGTTISGSIIGQSDGECKATLETAPQVPNLVNTGSLGDNLGTISKFTIENCQAGDKFKVSATSPNNNTSSEVYPIQ